MDLGDTTLDAQLAQGIAAGRRSASDRLRQAAEMSEDARRISLDGIVRRHPTYTPAEARRALVRLLWGESLATRMRIEADE